MVVLAVIVLAAVCYMCRKRKKANEVEVMALTQIPVTKSL